jgi:hypothetical protein
MANDPTWLNRDAVQREMRDRREDPEEWQPADQVSAEPEKAEDEDESKSEDTPDED